MTYVSPAPPSSRISAALTGFIDAARNWRVCYLLGLSDIRRRYARSRLGQFWMTLTTGIMITTLAIVWSVLWRVDIKDLMPYIAASVVMWTFISGVLDDATEIFTRTSSIFLNQGMSFTTAIYALIFRHLLILLHNLPIILITLIVFGVNPGFEVLAFLPGLFLLVISMFWMSYVVALFCLRFRDLIQVVKSALLIIFYITPIFWMPSQIPPEKSVILHANPFAALLGVVRDPLIGVHAGIESWGVVALISIGGFLLSLPFIGYAQRRIVYWI